MSKTLRLYQPVKLRGEIGFLDKGDHKNINSVVIKHWLIQAMIVDGKAIVIDEDVLATPAGTASSKPGKMKGGRPKGQKPSAMSDDSTTLAGTAIDENVSGQSKEGVAPEEE